MSAVIQRMAVSETGSVVHWLGVIPGCDASGSPEVLLWTEQEADAAVFFSVEFADGIARSLHAQARESAASLPGVQVWIFPVLRASRRMRRARGGRRVRVSPSECFASLLERGLA